MTLQEKVIDGERVLVAETAEDLKAAINQDVLPFVAPRAYRAFSATA